MSIITIILATIVALEHFYIFYLESILTESERTELSRLLNKLVLGIENIVI